MVRKTRSNFDLLLVIKALDQGWQIDEKGQLLLDEATRGVYVRILTRAAEKMAELEEQLKKEQEAAYSELSKEYLSLANRAAHKPNVVRCKDCKHGSLYCTEDVCGETLIECNRPDLGDVIEIHGWKWFCADGVAKDINVPDKEGR